MKTIEVNVVSVGIFDEFLMGFNVFNIFIIMIIIQDYFNFAQVIILLVLNN